MYTKTSDHTSLGTRIFIMIWVVLALGVVYWTNPNFWTDSVDYFKRAQKAAEQGDYSSALVQIDTAIKMEPENTGYLVTKGYILMESGAPREAAAIFQDILDIDPVHREARFGMAEILFRDEKSPEAVEWLSQIDSEVSITEQLIRRAKMLAKVEQHEAALRDINKVLSEFRNEPAALLESARLNSALKRFDQAEASYRRLAEVATEEPVRIEALNGLAVSLRAQGKAEDAYEVFKKVPLDENLQPRAELAMETGQTDEAIRLYEELIRKQGESKSAHQALGTLYEMAEMYEKAIPHLEKSFAGEEMTCSMLVRLGDLYRWTSEPEKALERYQGCLALDDKSSRPRAELGMAVALIDMNEADRALSVLTAVLKARPGDPDVLEVAARAATDSGRPEGAVNYLEQLSESRELDSSEKTWLAGQYRLAGDQDAALALFEEVLAENQNDPALHEAVGDLYWDRGEHEKALNAWSAIPVSDRSEQVHLKIGRVAYLLGEKTVALQSMKDYLKINPDDVEQTLTCADLHQQLGDHDEAAKILASMLMELEKQLESSPENAVLLLQAARAYSLKHDPAAAVDALTKLESLRKLTREEGYWLAGQMRVDGDSKAALEKYEQLFAVDMKNGVTPEPAILEALGDLRSDHRRARAALDVFMMIPEAERPARVKLKIGRAAWRIKQLDMALAAVAEYATEEPQDLEARLDYISIMRDLGHSEEVKAEAKRVFDEAQTYLEDNPGDSQYLLYAARAASLSDQPKQAVVYLQLLSQDRDLSVSQQAWLAGQYRVLGDSRKAAELYEAAFAEDSDGFSTADLVALGDLRMDAGKAGEARAAYQLVPEDEMTPEIKLKYARALSKEDFRSAHALELYEEYLETYPENMDIHLEAARFFVNAGAPEQSVEVYLKVVDSRGAKGLELEIARACLAGHLFEQAEEWSRAAIEADDTDWQGHLALAQSLHLQGKVREADKIISKHEDEISKHPEGKAWLGLIAMSRDRHLAAFKLFSELLEDDATAERRFWIWRGESAQHLGNYQEAKRSFEEAENFRKVSGDGADVESSYEVDKQQAEAESKRVRDAGLVK